MSFTLEQIVKTMNETLEYKDSKSENVSFNYILKIISSYFPINKINIEKKSNKFHLFICSRRAITFELKRKHLPTDEFSHIGISILRLYDNITTNMTNDEIVQKMSSEWDNRKNLISKQADEFQKYVIKNFNLDLYDLNILIKKYDGLDFLTKEYLKSDAFLDSLVLDENYLLKDENVTEF